MDEPRGARAHARRPAAPGSGAAAARSTGARARRRATASTCATAYYDCDMDVLLFVVEQEGRGACHTGERSCFFRAFGGGVDARARCDRLRGPARRSTSSVELARDYTVVPVWREVLADLETPLSAFVKLVGDREGLPARVGRARRTVGALLVPRPRPGAHVRGARPRRRVARRRCPARGVPSDQGTLAALEALLARFRAPTLPELPPFHGGIVGWMGYDTVREIEHLPDVAARRPRLPRRGVLARRAGRRVRPLPPALLPDRERVPAAGLRRRDAATLRTTARSRGSTTPSPTSAGRCRTRRRVPPADELDRAARGAPQLSAPSAWAEAVDAAKEHILEGDIFQVVLAQRFDLVEPVDPLDVYRVLRLVNPSPYMYFLHHPEATIVGSSPEALVQLRDGRVISRPIAGHAPPRPQRGARPPARGRAGRAPEGTGRARDARRPRAQRRRPGRARTAPSRSRS